MCLHQRRPTAWDTTEKEREEEEEEKKSRGRTEAGSSSVGAKKTNGLLGEVNAGTVQLRISFFFRPRSLPPRKPPR
jgi:hypothetical protein